MAKEGTFLSRDDILSGRVCRTEEIDAGGGRKLRLRHLTADELLSIGEEGKQIAEAPPDSADPERSRKNIEFVARFVRQLAVDAGGQPLFGQNGDGGEEEDVRGMLRSFPVSTLFDGFRIILKATQNAMAAVGER
jgi:hypothetical protein